MIFPALPGRAPHCPFYTPSSKIHAVLWNHQCLAILKLSISPPPPYPHTITTEHGQPG